jgi:MoxR-like ATPase
VNTDLQRLDDRTVQMILSHLTQELREEVSESDRATVQSEDEARQAVAALLQQTETGSVLSADVVPTDSQADLAARETLRLLLNDPETAPKALALIEHPPTDSQLSVELAVSSAIVLGVLITWLQTKVALKVSRKEGKVEFEFELKKDAASGAIIKTVAETVKKALFLS